MYLVIAQLYLILMNIQNKQFTYIGVGCLSLTCLYYFFKHYDQQRNFYRHKKAEVQRACQKYRGQSYKKLLQEKKIEIMQGQMKRVSDIEKGGAKQQSQIFTVKQIQSDSLTALTDELRRDSNKKQYIFLPYIRPERHNIQNDTYHKYFTHLTAMQIETMRMQTFEEEQTGRRFNLNIFTNNPCKTKLYDPIIVQINSCNIQRSTLQDKISNNIIFQENRRKSTNSYNLTLSLLKLFPLSIYGTIRYSITDSCFIIDPEFILNEHGMTSLYKGFDTGINKIIAYWDQKQYNAHYKKVVTGMFMCTAFYFFIYRGLKSLWNRYHQKKENIQNKEMDFFVNKTCFQAKRQSKLVCQECKVKNVSIIYECGHLAICQDCNKLNQEKICPVCQKVSRKQIKIFL